MIKHVFSCSLATSTRYFISYIWDKTVWKFDPKKFPQKRFDHYFYIVGNIITFIIGNQLRTVKQCYDLTSRVSVSGGGGLKKQINNWQK